MKKSMIALGAATLCAAVSFADVQSANIVGYAQTTPENAAGYSFIIPTFKDVAAKTATYDLQNIKLVGAYGDGGTDAIIVYNEFAALTGDFYYWGTVEDSAGDMEYAVDGWYNGMYGDELVENITLPLGTGLYLNLSSYSSGAKVQYSGEVYQNQLEQDIPNAGYNMIGNSTPVPVDLQDIKLVGAYGDGGTDAIIVYNEFAALTGDFYYWGTVEDSAGDMEYAVDGWYNGMYGTDLVEGVVLQPGQGLYLNLSAYSFANSPKLVLPNPMEKKSED